MEEKITEAQKRAKKKWDSKNKDRVGYLRHKARAKSFITKDPKPNVTKQGEYLNDLLSLQELLNERIKKIQK